MRTTPNSCTIPATLTRTRRTVGACMHEPPRRTCRGFLRGITRSGANNEIRTSEIGRGSTRMHFINNSGFSTHTLLSSSDFARGGVTIILIIITADDVVCTSVPSFSFFTSLSLCRFSSFSRFLSFFVARTRFAALCY